MFKRRGWLSSRAVVAVSLSVLGLALFACSDGGSSPTEPAPPGIAPGSASLTGQVTSVTGAGGDLGAKDFAEHAVSLHNALPGVATKASVAGVTVRIQGTGLTTATDAAGRFSLAGVPSGDQVVLFEAASDRAALGIPGIQVGEQIELAVALQGSSVVVESMQRSHDPEEPPSAPELSLQMQPDTWSADWTTSSGSVSALIRGEGFERIDLDSILLMGTDPEAPPLEPFRVDREGNHVRAFFSKPDAWAILDDPQPGEVHTLTLELTVEGEVVILTAQVRIEEEEEEDEADVEIEKATNGEDADRAPGPGIPVGDPVEWTYVVTNTGDLPLEGVTVSDDQGVDVSCPGTTLDPGESMTCTGSGTAEAGQYSNLGTVTAQTAGGDSVTDQDRSHYFGEEEDEPGEVDLTLEMQPDSWNTNWASSSGTVSAFIRGEGFEAIDLDSIVLIGSDPGAAPLSPTRVDRAGNHVRAFFSKAAAFATLDDPDPGERHTVTIELTVDGEPVTLEDEVRIVGPG